MLRLLHVGLGPLGKMIVLDAARRGVAEVVAAVDVDAALAGKALSEVVPGCGFSARVVGSLDEMREWGGIDCAVVTTCSDLARAEGTIRGLLSRGVPVVSTCEELVWPRLRHAALADELDAIAKNTGARLVGTGVNPGFMMDALPVALTAVCRNVRRVHVWRIQDASSRRVPFQKKIGAGLDDSAFDARIADGSLRHVGLGESVHFIADALGMKLDRWTETIEPVKATRALESAVGAIAAGRCSGVRQVAIGWGRSENAPEAASEPLITLEFQAAIGQVEPPAQDRVVIDAEPVIDMTVKGGVHGDIATTAITLNAIPSLLEAKPGLHTMATMPMVRAMSRRESTVASVTAMSK